MGPKVHGNLKRGVENKTHGLGPQVENAKQHPLVSRLEPLGRAGLRTPVNSTARALDPPVFADGAATTILTRSLLPPMFADVTAATLLARALDPPVWADVTATTLFTLSLLPPMWADVLPPHSLHSLLRLPCC